MVKDIPDDYTNKRQNELVNNRITENTPERDLAGGLVVKNPPASAGDPDLTAALGGLHVLRSS